MARWLDAAGVGVLQLLPINEVPPAESSPYSALSAMAIDPQFISLDTLEDFQSIGGEGQLSPRSRAQLDAVRQAPVVDYAAVRPLKHEALRRCFDRFHATEWSRNGSRGAALRAYIEEQAWWIENYALFRALHARYDEQPWTEWPEPLRAREPAALAQARAELAEDVLFRQYLQWIADGQWAVARGEASRTALFGDLPFMVSSDSADVWAHQDLFRLDASVGVPPDAFSPTGQDWGLPLYRWDVFAARDFDWLRARARRNAALFDGYRVDHLVGFYRTYFRPHDGGEPQFTPADLEDQVRLGERVLEIFRTAGAEVTAEDLGVVPDFVRDSLARLSVPGYKVLRWERRWTEEGQPFKDPVTEYPDVAVATTGTHDTEPMAVWWELAPEAEREAILAVPSVACRLAADARASASAVPTMPDSVRGALLEALYASASDLVILPVQDIFGWRERINQPATVSPSNWTWRLPEDVDRWTREPAAAGVAEQLRIWSTKYGR